MSASTRLLSGAFGRINEGGAMVVDGLSPAELAHRIRPDANSIGWLVWHLARVQDSHIADAATTDQVWHSAGWQQRFDLPFDAAATGYGQSSEDVGAARTDAELLTGYLAAVTDATIRQVDQLSDADLDRVIDESWDPPVTLAVRLVSVIGDDLKHLGQAEYLRGLL